MGGISNRIYNSSKSSSVTDISCFAYNNANITLTTATLTALTFNSEFYDTSEIHSTSVNPSRFTIPVTGKYLILGNAIFSNNSTGRRLLQLWKNNVDELCVTQQAAVTGQHTRLQIVAIALFSAGDYVELRALQDSGGNLDIVQNGINNPSLQIKLI